MLVYGNSIVYKKYLLKKNGHRFHNFPEMRTYKAK